MGILNRAKDLLTIKPIRLGVNRDIRKMAKAVANAVPTQESQKVIISFNASTRITGLSLNAAFAMLTGWSLRLQGARVVDFVCQRGMPRCVLGTDNNDITKLPPCQNCLAQSGAIYDRSTMVPMGFSHNDELVTDIRNADVPSLTKFQYQGIPLVEL